MKVEHFRVEETTGNAKAMREEQVNMSEGKRGSHQSWSTEL